MVAKENLAFQNLAHTLRQMSDDEKDSWLRKASNSLRRDADELRSYTGSIRESVRKTEQQLEHMDQVSRSTQKKIVQNERRLDDLERSINAVRHKAAPSAPDDPDGEQK